MLHGTARDLLISFFSISHLSVIGEDCEWASTYVCSCFVHNFSREMNSDVKLLMTDLLLQEHLQ